MDHSNVTSALTFPLNDIPMPSDQNFLSPLKPRASLHEEGSWKTPEARDLVRFRTHHAAESLQLDHRQRLHGVWMSCHSNRGHQTNELLQTFLSPYSRVSFSLNLHSVKHKDWSRGSQGTAPPQSFQLIPGACPVPVLTGSFPALAVLS